MSGSLPTPQPKNSAEEAVDVAELRRLEAAATPAPWQHHDPDTSEGQRFLWYDSLGMYIDVARATAAEDGLLIAAARNALPSLLAEVDRLRAENEQLREALNLLREGDYDVGDVVLDGLRAEAERDAAVARAEAAEAALAEIAELRRSGLPLRASFWERLDAALASAVPPTRPKPAHSPWGQDPSGYCGCEDCSADDDEPAPQQEDKQQ